MFSSKLCGINPDYLERVYFRCNMQEHFPKLLAGRDGWVSLSRVARKHRFLVVGKGPDAENINCDSRWKIHLYITG